MRYLGVDLHTNSFTVCYLTATGRERIKEYQLKHLREFKGGLKKTDCVAVEATGNTRYFVDEICHLVKRVVVVCLLYTSPSPRDLSTSRMPSSA